MGKNETSKIAYRIFLSCLIVLVFLSFIKSIFVSFDLDEGYALASGYRMAVGDHLFNQMWEPHQLSAYPLAILLRIFLLISGGSTTGAVIYLRIVGCVIHALIGFLLYNTLTAYVSKNNSAVLALLHCLFLPKWLQIAEFELMQYWFLILIFICFTTCYKKNTLRKSMLILAGLFTLLSMTTYPTMCILFVPGIIVISKLSKNKKRDILLYCAGFFGAGILFLVYVFAFISPEEFINNLRYIFMDESHTTETGFSKFILMMYGLGTSCLINLISILGSFVVTLIIVCLIGKQEFRRNIKNIILYSLILSVSALIIYDIISITFYDVNVFVCTHFYLGAIILGIYAFIAYPIKELSIPFISLFLSGILSIIGICFMTNMSINVILSHAFPCVIAVFVLLANVCNHANTVFLRKTSKVITTFSAICLLGLFLFSRLIAIRVNGCLPVTIRAGLEKMTQGPLSGIYVVDDDAYIYNGLMDILDKYDSSNLLYIGGETWLYTYRPSNVCSASTQGTSSYNDAFIEYYNIHPEKLPNIIVYDSQLGYNPAYNTTTISDSMKKWLEETYSYTIKIDENFAVVYKM